VLTALLNRGGKTVYATHHGTPPKLDEDLLCDTHISVFSHTKPFWIGMKEKCTIPQSVNVTVFE